MTSNSERGAMLDRALRAAVRGDAAALAALYTDDIKACKEWEATALGSGPAPRPGRP